MYSRLYVVPNLLKTETYRLNIPTKVASATGSERYPPLIHPT